MKLADPLRPALLAASRSPRLERTVTGMRSTRAVVDRFVAGVGEADALSATTAIVDSGRWVTIDYLGEDTTSNEQATATVAHYLRLLGMLAELPGPADAASASPIEVSLKLSAVGQAIPADGHRIARDNAHTVCTAAAAAGVWVTIDAEDHTTTDSTLSIVRELRADFPTLGTVLQAYLHRTEGDCREFSGSGSRIRLCKGAYREPAAVAYQRKADVDASYLRCLRILMQGTGYPMVASHDPAIVEAAGRLARETGRGPGEFEYQMLYGIRDGEQRRLVRDGDHVRVYVPYGDQWYGYFVRRLAERPANVAFFLRSLTPRNRR